MDIAVALAAPQKPDCGVPQWGFPSSRGRRLEQCSTATDPAHNALHALEQLAASGRASGMMQHGGVQVRPGGSEEISGMGVRGRGLCFVGSVQAAHVASSPGASAEPVSK